MRSARVLIVVAVASVACSSKSKQPEGHASIMECVDGRITNTMEVAMSQVDDLETKAFTDCGDGRCVFEGEACPSPPADASVAAASPESDIDLTKPDRACNVDTDCVSMYRRYEDDNGSCCNSCSSAQVTKEWAKLAEAKCGKMGGEGCPVKKCVGLPPVVCEQGVCTGSFAEP